MGLILAHLGDGPTAGWGDLGREWCAGATREKRGRPGGGKTATGWSVA